MNWDQFAADCLPAPLTVPVQIYQGSNAYGDTHATTVDYGPCHIEDVRRAVVVQTVDAYGKEQLSSTTVFGPLTPTIPAGSLITLPGHDRPVQVIAVARLTAAGHDLPEHQELNLE